MGLSSLATSMAAAVEHLQCRTLEIHMLRLVMA